MSALLCWLKSLLITLGIAGLIGWPKNEQSLVQAVMNADACQVKRLITRGANLEELDLDQQTPLLIAAKTDQFEIAEMLLEAGANLWATSEFGWTVGYAAQRSRLTGGPDFKARQRFLDRLKERGFPFPAEHPTAVHDKMKSGAWPPR